METASEIYLWAERYADAVGQDFWEETERRRSAAGYEFTSKARPRRSVFLDE